METRKLMKISELALHSGLPKSTIHYYLRQGLLHPPQKTGRTMAYFDSSHLARLSIIKRLRNDLRMPIIFLKQEIERLEAIGNRSDGENELQNASLEPQESRKKEIINAAIEVFSQKGYHNTKVNDITHKAGISIGTFYIHFKNKRDLFIDVVEEVFHHIVGDAARNIKGEQNLGKRLIIRGRTFFENYTRYMEILNQLRAEIASEENWPQEKLNRMYRALTGPVIKEVREAIELGIVRPNVDPELLAFSLTGLIEVMSFRIKLDEKYGIEDVLRFIGDFLVNGLVPEDQRGRWVLDEIL